MILTAVRSGEARGARWDEFELSAGMWIIPVQRTKGGKEHRVPLSERALAILREMQELRQNDLIFPRSEQGRPLSDMSLLMLPRELCAHGLGIAIGNRMVLSMQLNMENSMGFTIGISMDKTMDIKMERRNFSLSAIDLSKSR